jgi:protein involved in polysaccharide export with SLBB domain
MQKKVIIFLIILLTISLSGQIQPSLPATRSDASRYVLSAKSDALLMTVKVWGEVQKPGLYDVPIGTDLVELISSAGGPTSRAKLSKVKIIHTPTNASENSVSIVNIKDFLDTGNAENIVEIKSNDTIVVPVKPIQYLSTSLSWTSQIINLIYIITMFDYYRTRP